MVNAMTPEYASIREKKPSRLHRQVFNCEGYAGSNPARCTVPPTDDKRVVKHKAATETWVSVDLSCPGQMRWQADIDNTPHGLARFGAINL